MGVGPMDYRRGRESAVVVHLVNPIHVDEPEPIRIIEGRASYWLPDNPIFLDIRVQDRRYQIPLTNIAAVQEARQA